MGENKKHPMDAWNDVQNFYVQDVAKAYGQLFIMTEGLNQVQAILNNKDANADTKEAMLLMVQLHALNNIYTDIGTWLEVEYFDTFQVQMIRDAISATLTAFKRHAVAYTYAFSQSEDLVDSMLAPKDGMLYKSISQRIYAGPGAFERIGNWRELYNH